MNLSRSALVKGFIAWLTFPNNDTKTKMQGPNKQVGDSNQTKGRQMASICNLKTCQVHSAPPDVDYSQNVSVFGSILRGESPASVLSESENVLVFDDRLPRAPLHALVIPKRFIKSVFTLEKGDIQLLEEMRTMGLAVVKEKYPDAYRQKDYILCYHVPPFNSVDHLHLHVLAPASKMSFPFRFGKYLVGTRWCTEETAVRRRLLMGKRAVPYRYQG